MVAAFVFLSPGTPLSFRISGRPATFMARMLNRPDVAARLPSSSRAAESAALNLILQRCRSQTAGDTERDVFPRTPRRDTRWLSYVRDIQPQCHRRGPFPRIAGLIAKIGPRRVFSFSVGSGQLEPGTAGNVTDRSREWECGSRGKREARIAFLSWSCGTRFGEDMSGAMSPWPPLTRPARCSATPAVDPGGGARPTARVGD
jgi:hypothetical protein